MIPTKRILVYLALLPFSFLLFALGWMFVAPSCLYHCWDDAPPFVISWYPPFIHPWADSTDGKGPASSKRPAFCKSCNLAT